ncbi:hypothetical protein CRUP_017753 [Coryphaenoides rupestris]|nr:hypothetical protein CRUP_017753 [Coryphaenoides rupestris]
MAIAAQSCPVGPRGSMHEAGTPWTRTALLVLLASLLAGIVASYPIQGRTAHNATLLLERRWETLFSRSYLGLSGGDRAELNWESEYLLGIKRVRRLYCNVGIGFQPAGAAGRPGSAACTARTRTRSPPVDRGVISLRGVRSEPVLCAMNGRGKRSFRDECKFKETLLANNYNAYESLLYRGSYIALSKHGRAKRGNKATTAMTVTHFLPRL